jgi:hypothetical protein
VLYHVEFDSCGGQAHHSDLNAIAYQRRTQIRDFVAFVTHDSDIQIGTGAARALREEDDCFWGAIAVEVTTHPQSLKEDHRRASGTIGRKRLAFPPAMLEGDRLFVYALVRRVRCIFEGDRGGASVAVMTSPACRENQRGSKGSDAPRDVGHQF